MRLLALGGDRAGALLAYKRCAEALRRELRRGAERRDGRAHTSGSAIPSRPTRASERARSTTPPRRRSRGPAARVGAAARGLGAGRPRVGLLRARDAARPASASRDWPRSCSTWAERQGVVAARTRSYAAEGRLSLAPVSDWLRSAALSPHLARLDDVWRVEVARIVPELLGRATRPAAARAADGVRRAPALLRGPGPGGARGTAAALALDRRPAMVRPRDDRVAALPVALRPARAAAGARHLAPGGARRGAPAARAAARPARRLAAGRGRARAARRGGDGCARRPGWQHHLDADCRDASLPRDRGQSAVHRRDRARRRAAAALPARPSRGSPGCRRGRTR